MCRLIAENAITGIVNSVQSMLTVAHYAQCSNLRSDATPCASKLMQGNLPVTKKEIIRKNNALQLKCYLLTSNFLYLISTKKYEYT